MGRTRLQSKSWIVPVLFSMLTAAAMALVAVPAGPAAGAQTGSGAELYAAHCASCHQAGGEGVAGTFPPLSGNPSAADPAYVESIVRNGQSGPIEVLGTPYDGVMPPVVALSDPEIAAVVEYVVELAGPADQADEASGSAETENGDTTVPVIAAPAGDAARGEGLFVGSRRLDAGSPACGSCHTAGAVGDFGGAALGPDLTGSFEKLGGAVGLTGWLGNPPSATMAPIYAERPLTDAELADLAAFLADAPSQERPDRGFGWVLVAVVIGLVIAIGLMAVTGLGARRPYVTKLRSAG